jgi:hypothetical protein
LLRRAVEIDARFADLDLGLTDATVMALAERHDYPILTFDFEHFRAAAPPHGYWRLSSTRPATRKPLRDAERHRAPRLGDGARNDKRHNGTGPRSQR